MDDEHTTLELEMDLLAKHDKIANRLRRYFVERQLTVVNLIGSPGAGKTALLEHTIPRLARPVVVIEADQATDRDARRIAATGARVVQINTGSGCHLDASMIAEAIDELTPERGALIAIENVGNLVCPALFDLGEAVKVAVVSIVEGVDKPLKYPHVFRASAAMVATKMDLAPYVDVDPEQLFAAAREVHPRINIFPTAAPRGTGLDAWCRWLETLAPRPPIDTSVFKVHPPQLR